MHYGLYARALLDGSNLPWRCYTVEPANAALRWVQRQSYTGRRLLLPPTKFRYRALAERQKRLRFIRKTRYPPGSCLFAAMTLWLACFAATTFCAAHIAYACSRLLPLPHPPPHNCCSAANATRGPCGGALRHVRTHCRLGKDAGDNVQDGASAGGGGGGGNLLRVAQPGTPCCSLYTRGGDFRMARKRAMPGNNNADTAARFEQTRAVLKRPLPATRLSGWRWQPLRVHHTLPRLGTSGRR